MTKKNIAIAVLSVITVACATCALTACGEEDSYYNLSESGTIYYEGEQTVKIGMSEYSEDKTTFKDTITKDDITLSGVLVGKTVKEVTYISQTEISVVLQGEVTANETQADDYGTITVAGKAMGNNAKGNCIVRVDFNPQVSVVSNSYASYSGFAVCSSTFKLPYGSFVESNVNTDNIIVPCNDAEVVVSVNDNGYLKILVNGYYPYADDDGTIYKYPVAKISANVTTFNTDLYVYVGTGSSYGIKETAVVDDEENDRYIGFDGNGLVTNGLQYEYENDGYTVTGYTGTGWMVVIPDTYNGKPVTKIGANAFQYNKYIQFLGLGANVKVIEEGAFYWSSLKQVDLGSVQEIKANAFDFCVSLQKLTLPKTLKTLGEGAFAYCKNLNDLSINDGVTEIPNNCFGNTNLKSVNIPSTVVKIETNAFYNCESLEYVNVAAGTTYIASDAFTECTSLSSINIDSENKTYSSINGVLFNANSTSLLIYPLGKKDKEYEIGGDVETVAEYAFAYNTNLEKLVISGNVKYIGRHAFVMCTALKTVECKTTLEFIDEDAFKKCFSLKTVTLGSSIKYIGAWAFEDCGSLNEIIYNGTLADWKEKVYRDGHWCYGSGNYTLKCSDENANKDDLSYYDERYNNNTAELLLEYYDTLKKYRNG